VGTTPKQGQEKGGRRPRQWSGKGKKKGGGGKKILVGMLWNAGSSPRRRSLTEHRRRKERKRTAGLNIFPSEEERYTSILGKEKGRILRKRRKGGEEDLSWPSGGKYYKEYRGGRCVHASEGEEKERRVLLTASTEGDYQQGQKG